MAVLIDPTFWGREGRIHLSSQPSITSPFICTLPVLYLSVHSTHRNHWPPPCHPLHHSHTSQNPCSPPPIWAQGTWLLPSRCLFRRHFTLGSLANKRQSSALEAQRKSMSPGSTQAATEIVQGKICSGEETLLWGDQLGGARWS